MKCPINNKHGELMLLVRLGTHKYDRDTQAYCKTCKEEKSDRIQDLLIDLMEYFFQKQHILHSRRFQ